MSRARVIALAGMVLATPVGAQAPDSSAAAGSCPVGEGFALALDLGAPGAPAAAATPAAPRLSFDTTYMFDVAERRWTRARLEASLAAGAAGSGPRGDWRACAGARISMQDPTLVIRGARGAVHLRVSLDALAAAGRGARADLPRR